MLVIMKAANTVSGHPLETNLDNVIALHGEVMTYGCSTARPERQFLAHAVVVLHKISRKRVLLERRPDGGITNGEPHDLLCR